MPTNHTDAHAKLAARKQIQWYGFRRDSRDDRDHNFDHVAALAKLPALPASVDLNPHCPPIMNQGEVGSCTAHGITGALRYLLIKNGKPDRPLSRLQLYYDERVVEGTVKVDAGAEIRDGIKCAASIGLAREELWPYVEAKFKNKPPKKVYADALTFTSLEYKRVAVNADAVKAALATGFPVVIGISVYEDFEGEAVAKSGVVPMPKGATIGGHCMYVTGYGAKPGYFTVRNSWDDDWGDKGLCYIPEAYIGDAKYGSDYWIITKLK